MAQFEKYFTVAEANALLPELREMLRKIQSLRSRVVISLRQATPVLQLADQNGGGAETREYLAGVQSLNEQVQRLHALGVQLKDVEKGLVDFPAWRDEREVLLCWRLGEDEVRFWHELDEGFSGRQKL